MNQTGMIIKYERLSLGEYYYQGSTSNYGNGGMDPYNNTSNYGMNNNSYGNNAYGGSVAPSTPTKVLVW